MHIVRELDLEASPERTFEFLDDLERYPAWMRLVHEATSVDSAASDPPDTRAWIVELQAQVGPFARSKRLRMVRTEHDRPNRVRFERHEVDGRSHAPWTLDAELVGRTDNASHLTMTLSYGGSLWTGAVLQRVLDDAVTRGSDELVRQLAEG